MLVIACRANPDNVWRSGRDKIVGLETYILRRSGGDAVQLGRVSDSHWCHGIGHQRADCKDAG